MTRIAICDDDPQELANLKALVDAYIDSKPSDIYCSAFQSGIDLLESTKMGQYDIVFLDVLMPQMTGMEAAREIRSFDKKVKIIFLTSSPEFAVESYSIRAYHYILKPVTAAVLFSLLDEIICGVEKQKEETLAVKYKSGISCLPFFQIEAVEVTGKTLYFYLSDGSTIEVAAALSEFGPQLLCRPEFIKTHRAFIVNMKCIKTFEGKEVTTRSGRRVLVAKSAYTTFREAYIRYLFEGRER